MIDIISSEFHPFYLHDTNPYGMILNQAFIIPNRKQAALLLADKLMHFRNSGAIIMGVPYGGAVVGYHLAEKLKLHFGVIGCKSIPHPADQRKTIGSINRDQVVIHDEAYDIPRDYIYHQIVSYQNTLKAQHAFYYSSNTDAITVTNADVIMVADTVRCADSLIASIRTLRGQRSNKITLAASMITPDAVIHLASEVDEIVSLSIEEDVPPGGFYEQNSIVRDEDVRAMVLKSLEN